MPFPVPVIVGGAIAIFVVLIFLLGYVKAPPDKAYIISGFWKERRILIGQAGIR